VSAVTHTDVPVQAGPAPTISSFTANPASLSSGQIVTLSWSENGATYNIISPAVGPIRGTSGNVIVQPALTTTYTFIATNDFGRATASVTVTVH